VRHPLFSLDVSMALLTIEAIVIVVMGVVKHMYAMSFMWALVLFVLGIYFSRRCQSKRG
jgi:predicted membrane protein